MNFLTAQHAGGVFIYLIFNKCSSRKLKEQQLSSDSQLVLKALSEAVRSPGLTTALRPLGTARAPRNVPLSWAPLLKPGHGLPQTEGMRLAVR